MSFWNYQWSARKIGFENKAKASQIRGRTSFHNSRSLFQKIDALSSGPEWTCELLEVEGDIVDEGGDLQKETVELWRRNPVECI